MARALERAEESVRRGRESAAEHEQDDAAELGEPIAAASWGEVIEVPAGGSVDGDFNGAPWSRVQQAFRSATGLNNQAGWDLSWPAWMPWPLRLPIDHVLTRGHLVVTQFDDGPRIDSDHLPVIAEIGWQD